MEKHIRAFFEGDGLNPEILYAGELSDSLITEDKARPFSVFAADLFRTQSRHKLLLVTKSPRVGRTLDKGDSARMVVSFSVNAEKVADRWEKAPPVKERIEAAKMPKDAGFEVRLRIDPMFPIEGWQEAYSALLEQIFTKLTPDRITIGSLRGLQSTINNSKDKTWTVYLDEPSNWGRKIVNPIRKSMYHTVIRILRDTYGFCDIALCKEPVQMWKDLRMDYRKICCNCTH